MILLVVSQYIAVGVVAGFLAGLLGIGGGIIVVPALVWIFHAQGFADDHLMQLAAGSSLAAMIISCFVSVLSHRRRGARLEGIYQRLMLPVMIGTIIGTSLATILKSQILEILFGCLLLLLALILIIGTKAPAERQLPGRLGMWSMGLGIGGNSGLFGVGGGIITVPLLTYFNVPLRNAVAVSGSVAITIALIGTISFTLAGLHTDALPPGSIGYVYWPAVLGITLVSPICAILGAKVAYKLPVGILRRIFAVFLVAMGIKMLV